nr:hypothetical protein [Planctomycetota bacterium]
DIVEQMAINRQAYRRGLDSLITCYKRSGDNMKLKWAENELKQLNVLPQYNYIIEAGIAGPELRAAASITEADYMYADALAIEKKAKGLVVIVDDNLLRKALIKYNELINRHPASDKIDDAAYRVAGICEHFQDYTIALIYYQRAYQWSPDSTNPARFKAAYVLDKHMSRRAEALELYRESLEKEKLNANYAEFAQLRIEELTRAHEKLNDVK